MMRFWRKRRSAALPMPPIYFPCPWCARPIDALNQAMMTAHAKWHADEAVARLGGS